MADDHFLSYRHEVKSYTQLLQEVLPNGEFDSSAEELLSAMTEGFIMKVGKNACKLAKNENSKVLKLDHILMYLKLNCNMDPIVLDCGYYCTQPALNQTPIFDQVNVSQSRTSSASSMGDSGKHKTSSECSLKSSVENSRKRVALSRSSPRTSVEDSKNAANSNSPGSSTGSFVEGCKIRTPPSVRSPRSSVAESKKIIASLKSPPKSSVEDSKRKVTSSEISLKSSVKDSQKGVVSSGGYLKSSVEINKEEGTSSESSLRNIVKDNRETLDSPDSFKSSVKRKRKKVTSECSSTIKSDRPTFAIRCSERLRRKCSKT